MTALTFNSVAAVLEREFHIEPARLRPDSSFGDLGLDARSACDFVMAVEDAFRLHIPAGRVDPRDAATDLHQLCSVLEALFGEPEQPGRRPDHPDHPYRATLAH